MQAVLISSAVGRRLISVKEKMVAAAMFEFLSSSPDARAKMFNRLESFLASKKK